MSKSSLSDYISSGYNTSENYTSDVNTSDINTSDVNTSDSTNKINYTNINLNNDIINEYNVICRLGSGAYSVVWLVFSISNLNYYALKVQNYDDYLDGVDEVEILKKLPKNCTYLNNMIKYFTEERIIKGENRKFLCTVYELCCNNLDILMRKGSFNKGYGKNTNNIFFQICKGIEILHNNLKVFHGDLKPDNILLKGYTDRDKSYINFYNNSNFIKLYKEKKKEEWLKQGKNYKNIKQMNTDVKLQIRKNIHIDILKNIPNFEDKKYIVDDNKFDVTIADFGHYCPHDEVHNEKFGTQMYQAPELILLGNCTDKVDIWALGCTLYELLTGELLFDPWGEDDYTTDLIHLKEIENLFGKLNYKYYQNCKYYSKFFKNKELRKYKNNYGNGNDVPFKEKLEKILINTSHYSEFNNIYDLLKKMLHPIPTKRISIDDILSHEWFRN